MSWIYALQEGASLTFDETPEVQQSIRMRPACDDVMCDVFNVTSDKIERFDKSTDLFILDQQFAIDLRVKLPNNTQITGQEKALSYKFYKFRTFTMEFWQNRHTKEPGEFFKIASQFYLHGYSDASGVRFIEWKIIDILKLIVWLKSYGVEALARKTRPSGGSRAAFLPIPYDKIPKDFILAEKRHYENIEKPLWENVATL